MLSGEEFPKDRNWVSPIRLGAPCSQVSQTRFSEPNLKVRVQKLQAWVLREACGAPPLVKGMWVLPGPCLMYVGEVSPVCLCLPELLCNKGRQSLTPLVGEVKLMIPISLFFLDLG